ncbi:hypothetical protein ACOTVQ_06325 [Aliarcobacter butzleri]|uniref:hypothetical protein n=1 Tax=Aliarcobacter butzleri TaxID=28197 RepID=UPI00263E4CBA|nr:hypothetical protein [Aliarcobacter butzleri]MCG3719172.1 hypothetical protein [Aliarcobacter butzleri]MDN5094753.1 hypothetical protein [Aliarcobacter butzleri]
MIEKQKIDYDKNPIEIKDYNTLFAFLITISMIPIVIYAYMHNLNTPGGMSEASLYRNVFIIIPFLMKPYIIAYLKSRNKRKIILMNDSIKFVHENRTIEEIKIFEITDIKRTYSDLYHKTQIIGELSYIAFIFVFIILLIADMLYILLFLYPCIHIFLVFLKYLYHKKMDRNYKYKLFDAILVYSKDRFINILPSTNKEYEEVRNYFLDKGLGNIKDKKIFMEIGHLYEKIDLDKH